MFFPILKRSNIHIIIRHQFSFALINTMFDHPFIIFSLSLHEKIPTFLAHIEVPCKFRVIFKVYLDTVAVLVAEIMLAVVHLIVEIVDNAFVSVRTGLWFVSEVHAVLVFFYHWVRQVDIKFLDEPAESFVYFLDRRVLGYLFGVVPRFYDCYVIQVFYVDSDWRDFWGWSWMILYWIFDVSRLFGFPFRLIDTEPLPPNASSPSFVPRQGQFFLRPQQIRKLIDQKPATLNLALTIFIILVKRFLNLIHTFDILYLVFQELCALIRATFIITQKLLNMWLVDLRNWKDAVNMCLQVLL